MSLSKLTVSGVCAHCKKAFRYRLHGGKRLYCTGRCSRASWKRKRKLAAKSQPVAV